MQHISLQNADETLFFFTTILYPSVTGLSWDSGQVTTAYKRSACLKPKQIITGYITNLWIKFSVWIWDFRLGPNIPKKPCFFGTNFSPMPVNKSTVQVKREHLMQKGKNTYLTVGLGQGPTVPSHWKRVHNINLVPLADKVCWEGRFPQGHSLLIKPKRSRHANCRLPQNTISNSGFGMNRAHFMLVE